MSNQGYKNIIVSYSQWMETLGFTESTVIDCKDRVTDFFLWLESKNILSIQLLSPKTIFDYFGYLEVRPNKRKKGVVLGISHLNHNFFAVDKLLEFFHHQGLHNLPSPTLYRIKPDNQARIEKIQPFTQLEIKSLYSAIIHTYEHFSLEHREAKHQQLRLSFALFYGCGLRRSEGYRLTISDIDFDRRAIFIKQGKGNKDRVVPMSAGVFKDLQEYVYGFRCTLKLKHNRLFVHTANTILVSLKYLQNHCGDETIKAKRIDFHIMRHSIATHLLQNGMSIENIALFLGHDSLESTQIYTHLL